MKDVMNFILGLEKVPNKISCFCLALQSARRHAGRNVKTGEASGMSEMQYNVYEHNGTVENNAVEEGLFTGVLLYLIVLDQIGCMFASQKNGNGIKAALQKFSDLGEEERKAICQLRNTFAHNFGLATERKPGQHFHFALSFNPSAQLVEFPAQEWDNDFSGKSDENCTVIGLVALCNMVEQTVKNVYAAHKRDELNFNCEDTEILTRFSMCIED